MVDVAVLGSGVAGLSCALRLAESRSDPDVLLVTKTPDLPGGASVWAQGGLAAAMSSGDSFAAHAADTLRAGAGSAAERAVLQLVRGGPAQVRRLIELGARFDRDRGGSLDLGHEAAHSRPRIVHALGDATGSEIVRALTGAVVCHRFIRPMLGTFAIDLLLESGRVVGFRALDQRGEPLEVRARHVVLATGGIGRLYRHTTNPVPCTGDGIAMAARAGAELADMEMVQFHPTALDVAADPMPLVTEAIRGSGAVLVDDRGDRFMTRRHRDAELAPRDVVARAIEGQRRAGRRVFLDARDAVGAAFPDRFPTVFTLCRSHGVDPRVDPIPVAPAAHYHMGGVAVDGSGATSLPGLWACGEVACTGAHGANRLASNSLLEGLVWGQEVADAIVEGRPPDRRFSGNGSRTFAGEGLDSRGSRGSSGERSRDRGRGSCSVTSESPVDEQEGPMSRADIRTLAWQELGLSRRGDALQRVHRVLATGAQRPCGHSREALETANMALVGALVAFSARIRVESRGAHFREDAPAADPRWRRRNVVCWRGPAQEGGSYHGDRSAPDRAVPIGQPCGHGDPCGGGPWRSDGPPGGPTPTTETTP